MAVETVNSNLFRAREVDAPTPDPIVANGRPYVTTGSVANAADASSGSKYHLCDLPSDCMVDPATFFVVDAWGFASVRIGTFDDNDALVSVAKSAAATNSPVVAGDTKFDKRLWEVLGLSEDPGSHIGIYAHAIAGATGAGVLRFRITTVRNT